MCIQFSKKVLRSFCLSLGLFTMASGSAFATAILHFEDATSGTSVIGGALSSLGLSDGTTFTSDTTAFNDLLLNNSWDLVIFGEQGGSAFNNVSTTLTSYVNNGGRVLGTTWLDATMASLFQAQSQGMNASSITTEAHPIFDGLGADIALNNPGWGTYAHSWNPLESAIGLGSLGDGFAAVLGNNGNTLLSGPLFDAYADLAEGELYAANQISFLLGHQSAPVSEPSVIALFGFGLAGLVWVRRRRR